MAGLDVIHQAIRSCRDCNLHVGRTNAVPGEGSPDAEIMFVGEGPGLNEDKQARPFVGAAGQFLNLLLSSIGLVREDVFITNIVKCRPPNNRDPYPDEVGACLHYLDEQIESIKPKIIVPLGRHALSHWFPNESIGRVRAKPKRLGDLTLFPLYHPAAALHNGGLRQTIEEDFAKLGELLKELLSGAPPRDDAPESVQFDALSTPELAEPQHVAEAPALQAEEDQQVEAPPADEESALASAGETAAEPEQTGQQLSMF